MRVEQIPDCVCKRRFWESTAHFCTLACSGQGKPMAVPLCWMLRNQQDPRVALEAGKVLKCELIFCFRLLIHVKAMCCCAPIDMLIVSSLILRDCLPLASSLCFQHHSETDNFGSLKPLRWQAAESSCPWLPAPRSHSQPWQKLPYDF